MSPAAASGGRKEGRRCRVIGRPPATAGNHAAHVAPPESRRESDSIRLPPDALETRRRDSRPYAGREPVGCEFAFPRGCRPDVTAYLSPALRTTRAAPGRTTGEARPARPGKKMARAGPAPAEIARRRFRRSALPDSSPGSERSRVHEKR